MSSLGVLWWSKGRLLSRASFSVSVSVCTLWPRQRPKTLGLLYPPPSHVYHGRQTSPTVPSDSVDACYSPVHVPSRLQPSQGQWKERERRVIEEVRLRKLYFEVRDKISIVTSLVKKVIGLQTRSADLCMWRERWKFCRRFNGGFSRWTLRLYEGSAWESSKNHWYFTDKKKIYFEVTHVSGLPTGIRGKTRVLFNLNWWRCTVNLDIIITPYILIDFSNSLRPFS